MQYDIVVLGSGPGGYVAAIKAAQLGSSVAIVEKESFGGVCLNWGCIPTKALLKSSKVYQYILNANKYGIDIEGVESVSLNWYKMLKRKDNIVKKLTSGVEFLLKKNKVDIYRGWGEVLDKNTIKVGDTTLKCRDLIISTGSSPIIPEIKGTEEGMRNNFVLTSKEALSLSVIPKELVILGGGVIGVEFATLFASLGKKVTIIQKIDKILEFLDDDVVTEMKSILNKLGVDILYSSSLEEIKGNTLIVKNKLGEIKTLKPDKLLISIGRSANLEALKSLNLKTYRRGIVTNDKTETNIPNVYAIGDVNGIYNLAHVASAEGIVAVENIIHKNNSTIDYKKIPNCIYTSPEMAAVGYNERDARREFKDIIVSKFPLSANGKALAEGEDTGFIKIIAESEYGEIIGVHIVAPTATDMISEIVTTMKLEGTIYDLAKVVHPHPTLSEIIMEAAHGAIDKPIHF